MVKSERSPAGVRRGRSTADRREKPGWTGKGPDFGHAGNGGNERGHGRDRPAQLPRRASAPRQSATTSEPAMGCGQAV